MIAFINNKYIKSINILNDRLFVERHEINASSFLNWLLPMLMNRKISLASTRSAT